MYNPGLFPGIFLEESVEQHQIMASYIGEGLYKISYINPNPNIKNFNNNKNIKNKGNLFFPRKKYTWEEIVALKAVLEYTNSGHRWKIKKQDQIKEKNLIYSFQLEYFFLIPSLFLFG